MLRLSLLTNRCPHACCLSTSTNSTRNSSLMLIQCSNGLGFPSNNSIPFWAFEIRENLIWNYKLNWRQDWFVQEALFASSGMTSMKNSIADTIPGSYRPNRTRPKTVITKLFVTTSTTKIKSGFREIDTFKLHYDDHQFFLNTYFGRVIENGVRLKLTWIIIS